MSASPSDIHPTWVEGVRAAAHEIFEEQLEEVALPRAKKRGLEDADVRIIVKVAVKRSTRLRRVLAGLEPLLRRNDG